MKTKNIGLMVALMAMAMQLKAQDTITIEHPDKVVIETTNRHMNVIVQGKEGDKDYRYRREVELATNDPVVTKERSGSWDFNIPFTNQKKKTRRHKNEFRLHGVGFGLVSAIDAPAGMKVDMSSSYEIMGPALEWAYYPGTSDLSLSWGIGLNWKNYRMTGHTRFMKQDGMVMLGDYPEGADIKFSRLKVFSLTLPLMLRYDFTRKIDFSFGPVVNFNTHASLKTRYTLEGKKVKETAKDLHQNRVTVDVMAHFSVGTIGIYAKYAPCKVLNTEWGPDFRGFSAGMTFYW